MSTFPFDHLPTAVRKAIVEFLPATELENVEVISKLYKKIYSDPNVWTKVANRLGITITHKENPRVDVVAYYGKLNKKALEILKPDSEEIVFSEDVFKQNMAIENYVKKYHFKLELLLTKAVKDGLQDLVKIFLSNGVSINREALETAVRNGDPQMVKILLEAGVPISHYCLEEASRRGFKEIVRMLIEARAPFFSKDLTIPNEEIRNLVQPSVDLVEAVYSKGIDHNQEYSIEEADAAYLKNLEHIKSLLEAGVPIPSNIKEFLAPSIEIDQILDDAELKLMKELWQAIIKNDQPQVKKLLGQRVKVSAEFCKAVIRLNNIQMLKIFIESRVLEKFHLQDEDFVITAMQTKNADLVKMLLETGIPVLSTLINEKFVEECGMTKTLQPSLDLVYAAISKNLDKMKALIESGVPIPRNLLLEAFKGGGMRDEDHIRWLQYLFRRDRG